jgi:hypothetical protein
MRWKKAALIQPQITYIPTTEETNPKNVIVNTNTTAEMVICEETGLKYAMPSANKKAEARNQLEIDDETGLKTTIEKTKTGNSKTTNNSNEPSRILDQKQIIPWQNLSQLNPKKNMKGRMKHKTERKAKKTKKTFQLNDTDQN